MLTRRVAAVMAAVALLTTMTAGAGGAVATVTTTNVGVDAMPTVSDGTLFGLQVREANQGGLDLNGDGDAADWVLHVYDPDAASLVNLGVAGLFAEAQPGAFYLNVNEAEEGADFNGDGDAADFVLHVYDVGTAALTNVGLAGNWGEPAGPYVPFIVREFNEGADVNGDGDAFDQVVHVYETATGTVTNLGLAAQLSPDHASAGYVAFMALESAQGATDLNGDGDAVDRVLHVFDTATATVTNTAIAAEGSFAVIGQYAGVHVIEDTVDLNGDGDTADRVFHVYDAATAAVVNAGVASTGNIEPVAGEFVIGVIESWQGVDFNGNGSATDAVVMTFDPAAAALTNTGVAGFPLVGDSPLVAMPSWESDQGLDLNGDGDLSDRVLYVHDVVSGVTTNVGVASTTDPRPSGNFVLFLAVEHSQGLTDLNGDGDLSDRVVHSYEPGVGATNLGVAAGSLLPMQSNGSSLFFVREADQGGTDLNGDGDGTDQVAHVYVGPEAQLVNLGLSAVFFNFARTDDRLSFNATEVFQGGTDLNGDGDTGDSVLHLVRIELPGGPGDLIDDAIDLFDDAVAAGDLVGTNPAASANARLENLRKQLDKARDHIAAGEIGDACDKLGQALVRTDGLPVPSDWVSGPAAADLAAAIQDVIDALGCP